MRADCFVAKSAPRNDTRAEIASSQRALLAMTMEALIAMTVGVLNQVIFQKSSAPVSW